MPASLHPLAENSREGLREYSELSSTNPLATLYRKSANSSVFSLEKKSPHSISEKDSLNCDSSIFVYEDAAAAAAAVIITFLSHLRNSASLQVSGCVVVFADSDSEDAAAAGNIS